MEIRKIKKAITSPKLAFEYAKNKVNSWPFVLKIKEKIDNRKQIEFYRKLFGEEKLVFDVGAHTGKKVDQFLKLKSKVIAIEAQSNLANKLKEKYSNQNVSIENCGLGSSPGEMEINISSKYPGFSSFNKDWQKGSKYYSFDKKEKVKMNTLDNLIKKYGLPYFCKIDVEGFEPFVLSGLSQKIPLICFEFHSNDKETMNKCFDRLSKLGYISFNFVMYENTRMTLSNWLSYKEVAKEIENYERMENNVIWGDIYVN